MSEAITAARPYAQAAFEQGQKMGDLKSWSELLHLAAEVVAHPDMQAVVGSPKVKTAQQAEIVLALSGGEKLKNEQRNFIALLAENRRLQVLPQIVELFDVLKAEAERRLEVVVTSAFDLNDAQKQKIANALKTRMGREISLSCEVNRDLLGGILIRAGDKVIDGSARTRLTELANALA